MKIIAGKHKGRKIHIEVDKSLRPTRPMVREAVFSILTSGEFIDEEGNTALDGALVLDLFSGSGSFAMEALSRGARHVILFDKERKHLNLAKFNIESIKEQDNTTLICADIERIQPAKEPVDIVFIDPPYRKDLIVSSIEKLDATGWLKDSSIIIAETSVTDKLSTLEKFELVLKREYGSSKVMLFRKS